MSQQEFNKDALKGIEKIGQGAVEMISSLESLIKQSYSSLGKDEAIKLAEMMNKTRLDKKVKQFEKEIKDLSKQFI
jgi:hypothetical protein